MNEHGSEETYQDNIVSRFKGEGDPDIVIVCSKLLTGFDAPRNTVLYLDWALKEHTLLQAIARVNRKFSGKDFGYIIDYRGILGDLDRALETYGGLGDFEAEDLETAIFRHQHGDHQAGRPPCRLEESLPEGEEPARLRGIRRNPS